MEASLSSATHLCIYFGILNSYISVSHLFRSCVNMFSDLTTQIKTTYKSLLLPKAFRVVLLIWKYKLRWCSRCLSKTTSLSDQL